MEYLQSLPAYTATLAQMGIGSRCTDMSCIYGCLFDMLFAVGDDIQGNLSQALALHPQFVSVQVRTGGGEVWRCWCVDGCLMGCVLENGGLPTSHTPHPYAHTLLRCTPHHTPHASQALLGGRASVSIEELLQVAILPPTHAHIIHPHTHA